MATNYALSPRYANENDYDDDSLDFEDDNSLLEDASDEDTEDASETDQIKKAEEFTEIKEQMYQCKLAQLKKQLHQLKDGTLPEYQKKLKKIEYTKKDRLRINDIWYNYMLDKTEKAFLEEKDLAANEFEDEKVKLKENLICEFEDKRTQMESDRSSIELTGGKFVDLLDIKPASTRKLRRRANDPTPLPEKRRKPSPGQMSYILDEEAIMDDLKLLNKLSGKPISASQTPHTTYQSHKKLNSSLLATAGTSPITNIETRIDDGRLYYDKKWFMRGQPVYIESKETGKAGAVISALGTQEIWLRRTSDNGKIRVYCTQLQKGKYVLKRRP